MAAKTEQQRADDWIEAQGPGFLLGTDDDLVLAGVAVCITSELNVSHEAALAAATVWRNAAREEFSQ